MQARFLCVALTHNHLSPPRKKLRIERCPLLPFTAHVLTDRPPPTAPGSNFGAMLQNYFRSGWAFLIPYLAAYLLYAWLKWPVNPVAAGSSTVGGGQLAVSAIGALPSTVTPSTAHSLLSTGVPCLLHVYWFLHALHLVLGALALRAWWKESALKLQLSTSSPTFHAYSRTRTSAEPRDVSKHQQGTGPPSAHLPPALRSSASSEVGSALIWRFAPWLLLALLFYIPGVYLEWPSDPWEHLRRINEWRVLDTVTAHSTWMKSSYFIPYSLLSWCVGLRQIFWLDFYYTSICLLLCWQYYRLARACDLSERAAMVFVLLQALLFGNNIFSFYRYYGISSSIYAQLGAVALTRIVLEAAKHPQLSLRSFFSVPSIVQRLRSSALRQPPTFAGRLARTNAPAQAGGRSLGRQQATTGHTGMAEASNGDQPPADLPSSAHLCRATGPDKYRVGSSQQRCPTVYRLLLSVLCLLPLIRYNHAQGLGIAGLGIGAVIVWRLIEWRRSALWWLIVTTLVINVLFLWLYPRPAFVEIHRAQGFLNAWYGFNILNLTSSAGDRMLQIVSVFGLVNLAAALVLIRRNHMIAWLTILPVAVMLLPCIAVPLEQILAQASGPDNVITFQRLFFSIPPCLAVVCLWAQLHHSRREASPNQIHRPNPSTAQPGPWVNLPADDSPPLGGMLTRLIYSFSAISLPVIGGSKSNRIEIAQRGTRYAMIRLNFMLLVLGLGAISTISIERPNWNRTWQALAATPDDLRMITIGSRVDIHDQHLRAKNANSRILTTSIPGYIYDLQHSATILEIHRHFDTAGWTPTGDLIIASRLLTAPSASSITQVLLFDSSSVFTCRSIAGYSSIHWSQNEVPLSTAGYAELKELCTTLGFQSQVILGATAFSTRVQLHK